MKRGGLFRARDDAGELSGIGIAAGDDRGDGAPLGRHLAGEDCRKTGRATGFEVQLENGAVASRGTRMP